MPCSYHIDVKQQIVFSRAWGVISDEDLHAHHARLVADPGFSPAMNQLYDVRSVSDFSQVSVEGIRSLAAKDPFQVGSRRALLTSTKAAFGLARMYELLTDEFPNDFRAVFDEAYLAERWIRECEEVDPDPELAPPSPTV